MSALILCPLCGGLTAEGSTCPKAIACPSCHAPAGAPCKRPSGHTCDVHEPRTAAAEQLDAQAGVVYP